MQKQFIALFVFASFCYLSAAQPGSGNCLLFTGNNYVVCGNPSANKFDFTGDGTIEAWVKLTSTPPAANGRTCFSILAKDESPGFFNKWIFGVQNGKLAFHINSPAANNNWVYSNPFTLHLNKYYHFAMTKNTGNMVSFYVNGVQMGTFTLPHATTVVNSQMVIGWSEVALGMVGEIDEVRFWKKVLTLNEIRDWMCRKVNSSHPAYSDLAANYRLDEGTGATTNSHNNITGTLTGGPGWRISGAPIGDAAAHDYISTVKSATISNSYGENLKATISTGFPEGIFVYSIDEPPNTHSGIDAVWKNDKYFGVFVAEVNSTAATYTAVYNYNGNPFFGSCAQCTLNLYKRRDNADPLWGLLNVPANLASRTITLTGENTEYIVACHETWPASLQNGLVAYYPFNGNANDQSGNRNNPSTVLGVTLTKDRYGNANAAYHFDGSSYIKGDCSGYPATKRTVSFWYRGIISQRMATAHAFLVTAAATTVSMVA